MLELERVTVRRKARTLIEEVDLTFARGCVTAILGPNGAGKSTALRVASGEWRPSAGSVRINGEDLGPMPAGRLAGLRAIIPQSAALAFPFTVEGVVGLGMTVPGFGHDLAAAPVRDAIADVGLEGFEDRIYTELSGGERQRVHIARALCQLNASHAPQSHGRLLLLDEPTASLDPAHQALVLGLMRRQAAAGWAVAVVLHDLNLAAAWADHVVLMAGGRVAARGDAPAVFTDQVLSAAYGCEVRANRPPEAGGVFVLPHHIKLREIEQGWAGRRPLARPIRKDSISTPPSHRQAPRTCD